MFPTETDVCSLVVQEKVVLDEFHLNPKLLPRLLSHPLRPPRRTLAITHITPIDEAIYQCIAENSAGTNQASGRLAISQGPELPEAPTGLQATALSSGSLQLTWDQPAEHVSQQIIGYVLHIRRLGGEFHSNIVLVLQNLISKEKNWGRCNNDFLSGT